MKRVIWAGALLGGLAASGCVLRDVNVGDNEGGAAGGGDTGPWGCLDDSPPPLSNDLVSFRFEVLDPITREPRTDASVRACSRFEKDCTYPLGMPVQVDASGTATLMLADNFSGYFEVYGPKGPDVDDPDFVRTVAAFPPRELTRGDKERSVFVFSKALLASLAGSVGGTFDGTTGLVSLTALDCAAEPAAGVSYHVLTPGSPTAKTVQYYTVDGTPIAARTRTDGSGAGGFTNLLPGETSLSATIERDAQDVPITKAEGVSFFVRAGWHSVAYLAANRGGPPSNEPVGCPVGRPCDR